jgi:polyisoprenoid-binding protein YceI
MTSQSRYTVPSILAILLCAGAPSSLAQAEKSRQSAPGSANSLRVDLNASRVYVKVGSAGPLGHEHGIEGRLVQGRIDPGKTGELVIDMRSFDADTLEARRHVGLAGMVSPSEQKKITANMMGDRVLSVTRFPRAIYKITSITPLDFEAAAPQERYQLDGTLTLHGVTTQVPLIAHLEHTKESGTLRLHVMFNILQSTYGITPFSALGGLARVADRLEIWGDLVLHSSANEGQPVAVRQD